MKVKILKNVVAGAKVHKKDQVVDLDRKTAGTLIDGEFAEATEEKSPEGQKDQKPPKE